MHCLAALWRDARGGGQVAASSGIHSWAMSENARILLVEDDRVLGPELAKRLEREKWVVDLLTNLGDAFEAVLQGSYRAIILDRRLPDGDGTSLLPAIRSQRAPPPVIILTARDEVADRIEGLDAGADDYLVKPFAFAELLARLRAHCRRAPGSTTSGPRVQVGNLRFDPANREASVGDASMGLPRRELALLELLVRRAGRVVMRSQIDAELYGIDEDVSSTAMETHVSRLRRRLQDAGAGVEVRTVRGLGYLLQPTC